MLLQDLCAPRNPFDCVFQEVLPLLNGHCLFHKMTQSIENGRILTVLVWIQTDTKIVEISKFYLVLWPNLRSLTCIGHEFLAFVPQFHPDFWHFRWLPVFSGRSTTMGGRMEASPKPLSCAFLFVGREFIQVINLHFCKINGNRI